MEPELDVGRVATDVDDLRLGRVNLRRRETVDDHLALNETAKIPAIDIIDFDYPPWHTSADTLDKLSAASLQTIGRVTLWLLARELAK